MDLVPQFDSSKWNHIDERIIPYDLDSFWKSLNICPIDCLKNWSDMLTIIQNKNMNFDDNNTSSFTKLLMVLFTFNNEYDVYYGTNEISLDEGLFRLYNFDAFANIIIPCDNKQIKKVYLTSETMCHVLDAKYDEVNKYFYFEDITEDSPLFLINHARYRSFNIKIELYDGVPESILDNIKMQCKCYVNIGNKRPDLNSLFGFIKPCYSQRKLLFLMYSGDVVKMTYDELNFTESESWNKIDDNRNMIYIIIVSISLL